MLVKNPTKNRKLVSTTTKKTGLASSTVSTSVKTKPIISPAPQSKQAGTSGKKPVIISFDTFVRTWMQSTTLQQVSKKLGIPKENASKRAMKLRHRGVDLPHMQPTFVNKPQPSVADLNKIVDSYRVKQQNTDKKGFKWNHHKNTQ